MKIAGALFAVAVVLCVGLLVGQQWADDSVAKGQVATAAVSSEIIPEQKRRLAPDFELVDLAGDLHKLSDYKGRVVFLNFWATWCGPCKKEAPSLQRLYQSIRGEEFELLAISTDKEKNPIGPFVDRYNLTFPILWDWEQKAAKHYRVAGIPVSLLIDRQGRVASRIMGGREWDSAIWENAVKSLLAEGDG